LTALNTSASALQYLRGDRLLHAHGSFLPGNPQLKILILVLRCRSRDLLNDLRRKRVRTDKPLWDLTKMLAAVLGCPERCFNLIEYQTIGCA